MTLADIIEIGQMAKDFHRLYQNTGLCSVRSGCMAGPEVQITPKEFYGTFGDVDYTYNHDKGHVTVGTIINGVRFFALINGAFVNEVQA